MNIKSNADSNNEYYQYHNQLNRSSISLSNMGKELLETVIPVDDRVCLYFYVFIHRNAQVMIIYNLCKCNILQQCNQSMFLFIL